MVVVYDMGGTGMHLDWLLSLQHDEEGLFLEMWLGMRNQFNRHNHSSHSFKTFKRQRTPPWHVLILYESLFDVPGRGDLLPDCHNLKDKAL